MCGRYAAAKDTATLVDEFEVDEVVDPAPVPRYNVAPTHDVPFVVTRSVDERLQRQLRTARWGLVPSWAKDPKIGARMINARWEQAAQKPAFRAAMAKRRCVLPADGYFEWYQPRGGVVPAAGLARPGARPVKPRKQPFFIHRDDGRSLALAGLYEFWRPSPEEPWLVTVAVLTTQAAEPLRHIHDRMPVMLDSSALAAWLDLDTPVDPDFSGFLPAEQLIAYPVSTQVNSVANDGPRLLEPLSAQEEPA